MKETLVPAAAVCRGVAHHDEAISGSHRLHLCDDYVGRSRLQCARQLVFYFLDNNTLAEANGGPPLVSYGGTLSNGYHFGVNKGLSLSGTGAFDSYSIDIHFYFDSVNASFNGYQRILDFKNRTSDSGLYSLNGSLVLFASSYQPGDPSAGSTTRVFTNGTMADLLVTRNASGLFSAYVNGNLAFSVMDTDGGHEIFR